MITKCFKCKNDIGRGILYLGRGQLDFTPTTETKLNIVLGLCSDCFKELAGDDRVTQLNGARLSRKNLAGDEEWPTVHIAVKAVECARTRSEAFNKTIENFQKLWPDAADFDVDEEEVFITDCRGIGLAVISLEDYENNFFVDWDKEDSPNTGPSWAAEGTVTGRFQSKEPNESAKPRPAEIDMQTAMAEIDSYQETVAALDREILIRNYVMAEIAGYNTCTGSDVEKAAMYNKTIERIREVQGFLHGSLRIEELSEWTQKAIIKAREEK